MDASALRCTVPVEICGKICEFGLRPDRYYSRVPVDIWHLFKTTLIPTPPSESLSGDDVNGCLGMCSAEFSVLSRNLSDHMMMVSRESIPTIGLSTLMDARLVYNFGDNTVMLAEDYAKSEMMRPRSRSSIEMGDEYLRMPDERSTGRFDDIEYERRSRFDERDDEFFDDRRPNESPYSRRNERPDYSSPPANFPPDYSGNLSRREFSGPGNLSEYDRRPSDNSYQRPQFDNSFMSDIDGVKIQRNRRDVTLKRDASCMDNSNFEQNISQQLSLLRQQSNLPFENMASRNMKNVQVNMHNERNVSGGPNAGKPETNEQRSAKKKKYNPKCVVCHRHGHVVRDCEVAKARRKEKADQYCDFCDKPGHSADFCREKRAQNDPVPKPKCDFCKKYGHTTDQCFNKKVQTNVKPGKPHCVFCNRSGHVAETCRHAIAHKKQEAKPRCESCKKIGHATDDCRLARCDYCKKAGHSTKMCRFSKVLLNPAKFNPNTNPNQPETQPWDSWVLSNMAAGINPMNQGANMFQMFGGQNWPNV